MPKHVIDIQKKRGLRFPYSNAWLKYVIGFVLREESISYPVEIGCVITDDISMAELNKQYRGIDQSTDVLSFALTESDKSGSFVDFPTMPNEIINLGEIIISYPRAKEQAIEHGNTMEQELILLIVHGTLHLLGYDHEKLTDARKMQSREKSVIKHIAKERKTE